MTYISRVSIPVEVLHSVGSGAAATRRSLLLRRVEEGSILLLVVHGRFLGRLRTRGKHGVGRAVGGLEHLLATSMSPATCI